MSQLYNKPKKPTYSFKTYEGHNNEDIISLINELNDCKSEMRRIENQIKEIQDNCEHEYLFVSDGMYEDSYTCCKCGHDTCK